MPRRVTQHKTFRNDLASWNFILFLTLAFILLIVVLTLMKNVTQDVRSKAGFVCPTPVMPRAEDCAVGWTFKRDTDGCLKFFCNTPTTTPVITP